MNHEQQEQNVRKVTERSIGCCAIAILFSVILSVDAPKPLKLLLRVTCHH